MKIKFTRDTLSETYLDAVKIRHQVFVLGQGVPYALEVDANEACCIHFVLYDDQDRPAATCRLLPNTQTNQVTLQRMAVLESYRGQHLGKQLLEQVLHFAQNQQYSSMILHAQLTAKPFYDKMGFTAFGQEFEEAGIKHISMKKGLHCDVTPNR